METKANCEAVEGAPIAILFGVFQFGTSDNLQQQYSQTVFFLLRTTK
jgi:hypothetical protein